MSTQLALLNRQVGVRLDLKEGDLGCLDLIGRHGPLSPTALARRTGLHPATLTGILDRLERGGWITRDRDPSDRRGVTLRALGKRSGEIVRLYSGMASSLDQITGRYSEAELQLLADFLGNTVAAGRTVTAELTGAATWPRGG